jgi:hypothetical protein
MKLSEEITCQALQLFEPDPEAVYTLEVAERLAHVPRRLIAVYYNRRLSIQPAAGSISTMRASARCAASNTCAWPAASTWLASR